jgi:hypothetical protein
LESWLRNFLHEKAQRLDDTNWFSRHTHLRRILVPNRQRVYVPSQMGRVDPFETPEGPFIGKVFSVASGAEIREGRLVINDDSVLAGLGSTSRMVPLMEYGDANRLLMAVNQLRHSLPAARYGQPAEAALVQTGLEPANAEDFWTGRNLLTAFISQGELTTADGILISEPAARKLGWPVLAAAGDKMANRHGIKGAISRVLPENEMPRLPDGTPVELVYSFHSLHSRLTFGLVLEAVLGRIARAEGRPVIAPPFGGPSRDEIRARLAAAGLPESGMETLIDAHSGQPMPYPSTVGWVYWLRLAQLAESQLQVAGEANSAVELSDLEIEVLLELGAFENAREALGARALRWEAASDPREDHPQPSAWLHALARRLQAAGLQAELTRGSAPSLHFDLCEPCGELLRLAQPVPHPWLPEAWLEVVGSLDGIAKNELQALREANERLARLARSQAPERLLSSARHQVSEQAGAYLDALVPTSLMQVNEAQRFSAQGVIGPAPELDFAQLGLPEAIAWTWFGPQIAAEVGKAAVDERTPAATQALDRRMQQSWVLVARKPVITNTAIVAFHPQRVAGAVIRLPALALDLMAADFDGDSVALYLPLSQAAQMEAGQKLSMAAHLARDPHLLGHTLPCKDAQWGLAWLSLSAAGQRTISSVLDQAYRNKEEDFDPVLDLLNQDRLLALLIPLLEQRGTQETLTILQALSGLGYAAVGRSGASLSPFAGRSLNRPAPPADDDLVAWQNYGEQWREVVWAGKDFEDPELGPQWLAMHAYARGRWSLPVLVGPLPSGQDHNGNAIICRHSEADGRPPAELFATLNGARSSLARLGLEQERLMKEALPFGSERLSLLARARRARRPGIIFARAAADGTSDPLTDPESRVLAGL